MSTAMANRIRQAAAAHAGPKRGDALFEGTSYPRTWDEFIGQEGAVDYIQASCMSARLRDARLEHTLIATGGHGIGKSALARLIAKEMGVGLFEVQGEMDENEAMRVFSSLSDKDILFIDEIHKMVAKSRVSAEWLLPVLQDGVLVTSRGVQRIPDVTIVAATTDVQKLPETIISRFVIKPALEEYTPEQAETIARVTARRLFDHPRLLPPSARTCAKIARAANNNPRNITALLTSLRDAVLGGRSEVHEAADGSGLYELDVVFRWLDVAPDGLDKLAQLYLIELLIAGKPLSEKNLAARLNEPTPPRHTEKLLQQRGYLEIGPKGRELTPAGYIRAQTAAEDRGLV